MTPDFETIPTDLGEQLGNKGYAPAEIYHFLERQKYAKVVELCRQLPDEMKRLPSVRLAEGRAMYHTGQLEAANKLFDRVLSDEPDNIVALKYLGDIRFANKDEFAALSYYRRVIEVDPRTSMLACELTSSAKETTHTVTLTRPAEEKSNQKPSTGLRQIHFYTETMGDLYLAQGHNRMALAVFEKLSSENKNPRLREKLEKTRERIKGKG